MKINFNASAVIANNALQRNDNRLQESLQRLSSGLKIVNAKDNPSGLAMSKRMNAQIEGLNMATQNAGDGISVIEIADGAMSEIHDMLHRINELAVKSSTGTMTDDDRQMIQTEVEGLQDEITRIVSTTEFNGQTLLDGTFDLKGYTDNVDVKVVYYGDALGSGEYTIGGDLNITYKEDGTIDTVESNGAVPDEITIIKAPNETINAKISKVNGNVITIEGDNDFELKLRVPQKPTTPPDPVATATYSNVKMELEGFGAMDTQIGANEGQQLGIRIPAITLDLIGIADLDMKTQESARESLGKMGDAVKYVSAARSRLGAYQNRLEHTINSLDISVENMTAAYSRIMDLDMAEEMTEYTTLQVLSQASTSMLAQANQSNQSVLSLLQ